MLNEPVYVIKSAKTAQVYLDDQCRSCIFQKKEAAEAYCEDIPESVIEGPVLLPPNELESLSYGSGAEKIVFYKEESEILIELDPRMIPAGFYNHKLNQAINLLKQTKMSKYLAKLSACKFLVPVHLTERGTKLTYGVINNTAGEHLYLAFSDLTEYQLWASNIPGWKPLMIDYENLCRVGRKTGFMLNIGGNRFIIRKEWLKNGII